MFHWDNNTQPYMVRLLTCSGMDTCFQDHMVCSFLVPNWADRYLADSLARYGYLSIAMKIYLNKNELHILIIFHTLSQSPSRSSQKYRQNDTKSVFSYITEQQFENGNQAELCLFTYQAGNGSHEDRCNPWMDG